MKYLMEKQYACSDEQYFVSDEALKTLKTKQTVALDYVKERNRKTENTQVTENVKIN